MPGGLRAFTFGCCASLGIARLGAWPFPRTECSETLPAPARASREAGVFHDPRLGGIVCPLREPRQLHKVHRSPTRPSQAYIGLATWLGPLAQELHPLTVDRQEGAQERQLSICDFHPLQPGLSKSCGQVLQTQSGRPVDRAWMAVPSAESEPRNECTGAVHLKQKHFRVCLAVSTGGLTDLWAARSPRPVAITSTTYGLVRGFSRRKSRFACLLSIEPTPK
jgi:hypothetical protein